MLSGDHHSIDALGLTIDILDRHLSFAVGAQPSELTAFAHLAQPKGQLVAQVNRFLRLDWFIFFDGL